MAFCPNTRVTSSNVYNALHKISRITGGAAISMDKLVTYLGQNGYVDFWMVSLETEVEAVLRQLIISGGVISPQPGYFLPVSLLVNIHNGWNVDPINQPPFLPPSFDPSPPFRWPEPCAPQPMRDHELPPMMNFGPNWIPPPMPARFNTAPFPSSPSQPPMPKQSNRFPVSPPIQSQDSPKNDGSPMGPCSTQPSPMTQTKETQTTKSLVSKGKETTESTSTNDETTTSTTTTATTTLTTGRPSNVSMATASDELPRMFMPLNVTSTHFDQFIGNMDGNREKSTNSGVEAMVG